jgi:hypothetical protein
MYFCRLNEMHIPVGLLFPNDGKDHKKEKIALFLMFPLIMGIVVTVIGGSVFEGAKVALGTAVILAVASGIVYSLCRVVNGWTTDPTAKPRITVSEMFALLFVFAGLAGAVFALVT